MSFVGDWALTQLWLFWAASIAGAVLAGLAYPALFGHRQAPPVSGVEAPETGTVTRGA